MMYQKQNDDALVFDAFFNFCYQITFAITKRKESKGCRPNVYDSILTSMRMNCARFSGRNPTCEVGNTEAFIKAIWRSIGKHLGSTKRTRQKSSWREKSCMSRNKSPDIFCASFYIISHCVLIIKPIASQKRGDALDMRSRCL